MFFFFNQMVQPPLNTDFGNLTHYIYYYLLQLYIVFLKTFFQSSLHYIKTCKQETTKIIVETT